MTTFRCKRSGNTVSFNNPDDIASMRLHEGYEEIKNGEIQKDTNEGQDANENAQERKVLTVKRAYNKRK